MSIVVWNHVLFQDRVESVLFALISLINLQVNFYTMSFLHNKIFDHKQSLIVFVSQLDQDIFISFYQYKLLYSFWWKMWTIQNENLQSDSKFE
jgi:hypothetical protein